MPTATRKSKASKKTKRERIACPYCQHEHDVRIPAECSIYCVERTALNCRTEKKMCPDKECGETFYIGLV